MSILPDGPAVDRDGERPAETAAEPYLIPPSPPNREGETQWPGARSDRRAGCGGAGPPAKRLVSGGDRLGDCRRDGCGGEPAARTGAASERAELLAGRSSLGVTSMTER